MESETVENIIKRYAHNRWEMRQHFKWRLWETAEDDHRVATEIVNRELHKERYGAENVFGVDAG